MANLKSLPAPELIRATEQAVKFERASTMEVVRYFQEIADRKLYLERGFPSLFEMVTKHFGYCAASAQRRINSMRLVRDLPEVEKQIECGELSLTAAAAVQTFLYAEAKEKTAYTRAEKIELIESCLNKSTREVERELSKRNPERDRRESIRHLSEDRLRLSVSISEDLNKKLDRLRSLMSHSNPNMRTEDLLERLANMALEKLDPLLKKSRSIKPSIAEESVQLKSGESGMLLPAPEVRTRYIPVNTKRKIWNKNAGKGCDYIDKLTGRRCRSKHLLQIDHRQPFSHGGKNDVENLRILCAAHNRFAWEKCSGMRFKAGPSPAE